MSALPAPAIADLSDAELEQHILDCGRHFLKAHGEGDTGAARQWLTAQAEAVRSRSPAQVARMESCYFAAEGEAARRAAQSQQVING